MLEASHHYESVETDVIDDVHDDHDEADNDAPAPRDVNKVKAKPKKRTRRRAPPPKHGNGTSCGSFVCAFILALLVVVALLGIAIYILQQKGYHLESSGTSTGGSDGDSIYSWLRGSTTPQHNSQPIDLYKAGTKDETDNGNESDDSSSSSSISRSKGHNIEESTAEHPNEGLPLPATSHLSITSTSHVPGVNVAVANQPAPTTTKGVEQSQDTISSSSIATGTQVGNNDNNNGPVGPPTDSNLEGQQGNVGATALDTNDNNRASGNESGPSDVDNHSQVTATPPKPSTAEVKKTASPTGNSKVHNEPTPVKQQPTGSNASSGVVIADDDVLWKTEVTESQGESHPESDNSKPESNQPNIEDTTSKEQTKLDHADGEAVATTIDPKSNNNANDPPQSSDDATKSNEPQADNVKQEEKKGTGQSTSDSGVLKQQNDDSAKQAKTDHPTKVVDEIRDDDALWKVEKTGNDPPP
jgi:hypothetical protein